MLVIDRRGLPTVELRQVQLGDHLVLFRRQGDRAYHYRLFGLLIRLGGGLAFLVDALVLDRAFDGVLVVNEHALYLLEVEQAWAVDMLIDHARGQILG